MIVYITGGAGFVGSHLVDAYLKIGAKVVAIDNLSTGSLANLSDALRSPWFTFVEHNVSEDWRDTISALKQKPGLADVVLHFASPASPVDYSRLSIETLLVNSTGTRLAAEAAMSMGARFLFASTSEAYGDPREHPQRETYWGNVNPVGVRACYDEGKRFGEAYVSTMVRNHNLDGRIIRIFNTYGPRMRANDGRIVPNFIRQAMAGLPLTVYGDGRQTRAFCFISDLVDGVMRCASIEESRGTVINLGNPEEFSVLEFAKTVCNIVGIPEKIEFMAALSDDPTRRCPDISLAREILGWSPQIPLTRGVQMTIASIGEERGRETI